MDLSRRRLIQGAAAGVAGTALTSGLLAGGAKADTRAAAAANVSDPINYVFEGAHQAGVYTPSQKTGAFLSFDVTAKDKPALIALFKTLTDRVRFLTAGGVPEDLGVAAPPSDSGILGGTVPADGLTITVSVGSSLFDGRYGLAAQKPKKLKPMTTFKNDFLNPDWCHGDLSLQICANHPDTVQHAIRDIAKATRGGMQLRWRMNGFVSPPRPTGAPRNLMGFKDGTANPSAAEAEELIWVGDNLGEPGWAVGGSYQVLRVIRMLVEFWDRVSLTEQENMFGRRRDSGAPLDGQVETDIPNYAADPKGNVMPLDSHIRMANPRTKDTNSSRLLRRGYNYDHGIDTNGNVDVGLIFCCYQQDVERQFEATQTRLIDEPLVDYIQPYGGGYFFTLPGVTSSSDYFAKALLA
jgi:deferrochelatase/peroxidase EfeB